MNASRKAVFLDRDGVIVNNSTHYHIWKKEQLQINPGIGEALRGLQEKGYMLIVVSNQGGAGKGLYTAADVDELHRELLDRLASNGVHIDAVYYCPHHDEVEKCLCRKPLPLMIEKAMARFGIDPSASWIIGDSERDLQAGRAAGLRSVLVPSNGSVDLWTGKIG